MFTTSEVAIEVAELLDAVIDQDRFKAVVAIRHLASMMEEGAEIPTLSELNRCSYKWHMKKY